MSKNCSYPYLPQTVPAAVEAAFDACPVAEAKTLPQRRPPLVTAAMELAAIVAVSAPGIWNYNNICIFSIRRQNYDSFLVLDHH